MITHLDITDAWSYMVTDILDTELIYANMVRWLFRITMVPPSIETSYPLILSTRRFQWLKVSDEKCVDFYHWWDQDIKGTPKAVTFKTKTPGARFTEYLTTIWWLSYDNAKVTVDLRWTLSLQNSLGRTQGFLSYNWNNSFAESWVRLK